MKHKLDWVRTLQYDGVQILVTREFSVDAGHKIEVAIPSESEGKPCSYFITYTIGNKNEPVTDDNWEKFCERENLINKYLDFLKHNMEDVTKH